MPAPRSVREVRTWPMHASEQRTTRSLRVERRARHLSQFHRQRRVRGLHSGSSGQLRAATDVRNIRNSGVDRLLARALREHQATISHTASASVGTHADVPRVAPHFPSHCRSPRLAPVPHRTWRIDNCRLHNRLGLTQHLWPRRQRLYCSEHALSRCAAIRFRNLRTAAPPARCRAASRSARPGASEASRSTSQPSDRTPD